MFKFLQFVARNPTFITKNARKSWKVKKAMDEFRSRPENGVCAWCGRTKNLEVHHIQPVSAAPDLADDFDNMIMLCRKPACHQVIGHNGDFRTRYVANVKAICEDTGQMVVKTVEAKDDVSGP